MTRVKQVTAAVTNVSRKRNLQRADGDPPPRGGVPATAVLSPVVQESENALVVSPSPTAVQAALLIKITKHRG
jgi:hypothetical protein